MASEWFCKKGDRQIGPLTSAELKALIVSGQAGPDDFVRKGTDGKWVKARNLTGVQFPKDAVPIQQESKAAFASFRTRNAPATVSEISNLNMAVVSTLEGSKSTDGNTPTKGPPPLRPNRRTDSQSPDRRWFLGNEKRLWIVGFAGALLIVGVVATVLLRSSKEEPSPLRAPFSSQIASAAQAAWAKNLGTEVTITNSIGMKMVLIPPGQFQMGSPDSETDRSENEFRHSVTVSRPYYLGMTEVTQHQWKEVMGTEPWNNVNENARELVFGYSHKATSKECPATFLSWEDAVEFCNKLSDREGKIYRLPTEAEWEYACRAGTETAYSFGDDVKKMRDYGRDDSLTARPGYKYLIAVGRLRPNAFGIFDMYGNACEWCQDWYSWTYYRSSPSVDPLGPTDGTERVLRGGYFGSPDHRTCRSASRIGMNPTFRFGHEFGIRVVYDPSRRVGQGHYAGQANEKGITHRTSHKRETMSIDEFESECERLRVGLLDGFLTHYGSVQGLCTDAHDYLNELGSRGGDLQQPRNTAAGVMFGVILYSGTFNMIALECVGAATGKATGNNISIDPGMSAFFDVIADHWENEESEQWEFTDPVLFWSSAARLYALMRMTDDCSQFEQYLEHLVTSTEQEATPRNVRIEIREESVRRFREINAHGSRRLRAAYQFAIERGVSKFGEPPSFSGQEPSGSNSVRSLPID